MKNVKLHEGPAGSESALLTEAQLLTRLPLSRPTVRKLREDKVIPHMRIGKRVLYSWPNVVSALERNSIAA